MAYPYNVEPQAQNNVYSPDQLIAGSFPIVTGNGTIPANLNYIRGTVLGQQTSGGAFIESVKTASDGSQVPVAILAEDTNTTATGTNAATNAPLYLAGEFDINYMVFDASWTAATLTPALKTANIYVKTPLNTNAIV